MIAVSFHEVLKVFEIGVDCIVYRLDHIFLGFLNDEAVMCNILMMKNFTEIINTFMADESDDDEEEKKEPPKAVSPSKDSVFWPSKILPPILRLEEKLRNDWRNHMFIFSNFMFMVSIFEDSVVEKKLFPILDFNLWNGNWA